MKGTRVFTSILLSTVLLMNSSYAVFAVEESGISTEESSMQQEENDYIIQTEYDKYIVVEDGMEFHYIADDTWQGLMVIVSDPSRLFVGMPRDKYNGQKGVTLAEIATRYSCEYAVNGGYFEVNNTLDASTPQGLVFSGGKMTFGSEKKLDSIIGWTDTNEFVCGVCTGEQAKKMGIRDAITSSPLLVLNGQLCAQKPTRMDARTAIGAREDGSILILSIDGRMSHSVGATWEDTAKCMYAFGAVNAGNIDGGGSSGIYYNGPTPIQNMSNSYSARRIPNAICVKP